MGETKRKERETKRKERERARQEQLLRRKQRSLHDKHKERRKKDCMIGMPFIIAFQGDPSGTYYCADYPTSFELIARTSQYPQRMGPFARLKQYLSHHVTQIHAKILIYKAA